MIHLKEGESIPFFTKADLRKQRQAIQVRNNNKVGRNDLYPCGSGKKYKKCCG
jgi:uncharacterized protein YecA (UPF0149 family)